MVQLLTTKLHIPQPRMNLVHRPRLLDHLDAIPHHKLTLISAPAGFGKTTLVSEWVHHLQRSAREDNPVVNRMVWLSLDEDDNDPARFLTYLITALNQVEEIDLIIGERSLGTHQTSQPPAIENVLITLINHVATVSGEIEIILIIDDYHIIESPLIDDMLAFLLEHSPQMHLVMITRDDPHLPLARLRGRGQLIELRAADLRFTTAEATEFLNRVMNLGLLAEDINLLEMRTEGWIVGLQLAALALQGSISKPSHGDASTFIQSFSGSHRFVLDYLVEEVLAQQPDSVQMFLLQTAILNRLTGPLCDAITGQDDGQTNLECLEKANLFIVPLDGERRWYRYHQLFAELLRQRLADIHPDLIKDLHLSAAIWHETYGDLSEAIYHTLAIEDTQTAARLIEKGARQALERSDLRFILNSVERLSDTDLKEHPWLFIYHVWALLLSGNFEDVGSKIEHTEWLFAVIPDDESQKREMSGFIAGLKAVLCAWQRDYHHGVDFTNQALANLSSDNWMRAYCASVMGGAFWGNGNLIASQAAFAECASMGKASGNIMLEVIGACNLAHSLEHEGHLQQAVEILQDSFSLVEQYRKTLPVAGYIHVELARVLLELNELEMASQHSADGIRLCQQIGDGKAERIGHGLLARVHLAKGDFANAAHSIQQAKQADTSPETTIELRGGEYPQVWFWLKKKQHKNLKTWLKTSGINIDDVDYFKTKLIYTMHARVLIALGREHADGTYLDEAMLLLHTLLEMAENNGWGSKTIEILALQTLALQAAGDIPQAITTLNKALTRAKSEGFIRIFVDEGPPMEALLKRASPGSKETKQYIRQLLAAFAEQKVPSSPSVLQPLIEPLSDREIEILEFIAEGLTNKEIADRLFLSLNTVKVHARNINSKLDAHNRTQAVSRGRDLGILPST